MNPKKENTENQNPEKTENKSQEKSGTKKRERKASKQIKVGITVAGLEILNKFLEQINKSSRRKINTPAVLEHAVTKLAERDIPKIQEQVYTPDDKIEVMFGEYNQRNPDKPLTQDQFKAAMLEAFEKQVLNRSSKGIKTEQEAIKL
jgi:hypothetical protein